MRQVTVKIRGLSPYSQSRQHEEPKLDKETHDAHDERTWRHKCTTDKDGMIVIPAMAFKQALPIAAKKLGKQIPGRGKSTYTKYFEADVICMENAPTGVHVDDVDSVRLQCNADGVRGSGRRVPRTFPIIHEWSTEANFMIFDDTVTEEVFEEVFRAAGLGVGIGRFRPENGGLNGRFEATEFVWE